MYTTENLRKRKALFYHPEISKAISAFWNVLDLTKDFYGRIRISDFMVMNIKIQKALMPGLRINVRSNNPALSLHKKMMILITIIESSLHSIQLSIIAIIN